MLNIGEIIYINAVMYVGLIIYKLYKKRSIFV